MMVDIEWLHQLISDRLDGLAGSDGDMCAQDWDAEDTQAIADAINTRLAEFVE